MHWYVRLARISERLFSRIMDMGKFKAGSEKTVTVELLDAINFSGFDIEPYEVQLAAYAGALGILFIVTTIDLAIFVSVPLEGNAALLILTSMLLPLAGLIYLSEFPKVYVRFMKVHSLGDIPEITSYLVMSMKLVPNMERAISFAAENSHRPLAADLRKMIWDLHARVYSSLDEALIAFANLWGKESEYLKRALHIIKSSTNEPDEAQRVMTLNKSLDIVLDGTRTLMEGFAAKLRTPTYVLYSIFILIPLALVALLPAVSIVGIRFDTLTLVLIYVVVLPLATFLYGEYILLQRPAAFAPPHIPERHPALANIGTLRRIAIFLALVLGTMLALLGYILLYFGNPYGIVSESIMGGLVPPTFPMVWGISAAISVYCTIAYMPYKRIRDGIKQIEREFADALFVLGRRVSEGRSAEWAFISTAETMRGSMISEVFAAIVGNLISLRATMHSAIFDEEYGALRDVYSDRVHTTMKLFTESVNRSHEAAGVAIVKLAEHLKELQEVEERIRRGLYDVTSTMRSTALIFAPLIAGVTLALSEVIQKILQSVSVEASRLPEEVGVVSIMKDVGTGMEQSVPPETFMLVIGIYVILMVVILVRFAGGIEYGGDRSQFMYELGKILPFAIIVFSITTLASRILFRSMV